MPGGFDSGFDSGFGSSKNISQSVSGSLTLTGILATIASFFLTLRGELEFEQKLVCSNPAWLLLDEELVWKGEWVSTYSYDINDTVLYKTPYGTEWHIFVSKTGHNVGNIPTESPANWRRFYQEKWL